MMGLGWDRKGVCGLGSSKYFVVPVGAVTSFNRQVGLSYQASCLPNETRWMNQ